MQSYQQSYFRIQRCLRIKSSSWNTLYHHILSVWVSMCCAMIGQLNGLYFIIQPAKFRSCFDLSGLKSPPLYLNPHIIMHNTYLTTLVFLLCTACYRTMLFQLRFKAHMLNRAWAIYPSGKNLVCILATQKANLTTKSYL